MEATKPGHAKLSSWRLTMHAVIRKPQEKHSRDTPASSSLIDIITCQASQA